MISDTSLSSFADEDEDDEAVVSDAALASDVLRTEVATAYPVIKLKSMDITSKRIRSDMDIFLLFIFGSYVFRVSTYHQIRWLYYFYIIERVDAGSVHPYFKVKMIACGGSRCAHLCNYITLLYIRPGSRKQL